MTSLPIPLPDGFSPTIQQDDQVTVGQIIAVKKASMDEEINIPKVLSIKLSKVKNVLKKSPGEAVDKGDIIAVKNNFLGTSSKILRSSVSGTVIRYERDSGNLVIKTSFASSSNLENIISPVEGRVILCNNNEIVINTDKNALIGNKSVGAEGTAELFVLEVSDAYHLDVRTIGKIVLGEKFTREMLLKGIGIGVAGIVGVEIEDEDLVHIAEKNFQTPIIEIAHQDLEKLSTWAGKRIFLDAGSKSIIFLHT
ncbi:MAG TPA: hypothetical protein VLG67_03235 [Candidatus Saccharimonadales bacterium]|nr:hypothetical protein [Candidatus Saccharimonadales bacterium]